MRTSSDELFASLMLRTAKNIEDDVPETYIAIAIDKSQSSFMSTAQNIIGHMAPVAGTSGGERWEEEEIVIYMPT